MTCRNCGRPTHTENRVHGRSQTRGLWHVHTHSDRVPCDPEDVRTLRTAQRASGHTHPPSDTAGVTPLNTVLPQNDAEFDLVDSYFCTR